MQSRLFDSCVNLTHKSYEKDLEDVLVSAYEQGVVAAFNPSSDLEDAKQLLAMQPIFDASPICFATGIGIHPHHAKGFNATIASEFNELSANTSIVGECGLDYFRDFAPRSDQLQCFEHQLQYAIDNNKPVFLHMRDAGADFFSIMNEVRDKLTTCLLHCFTDNKKNLFKALDLDMSIGVTGWVCDLKRGQQLREIVTNIPSNKLLIETDCPYLLPKNKKMASAQGRRNEPQFLHAIAQEIALLRKEKLEDMCNNCFTNSCKFFNIDEQQLDRNVTSGQ